MWYFLSSAHSQNFWAYTESGPETFFYLQIVQARDFESTCITQRFFNILSVFSISLKDF